MLLTRVVSELIIMILKAFSHLSFKEILMLHVICPELLASP